MSIPIFLPNYLKFSLIVMKIICCNRILGPLATGPDNPNSQYFPKNIFLENSWNGSKMSLCIQNQSYLIDNKGYLTSCLCLGHF